jgi:hypothetical protein
VFEKVSKGVLNQITSKEHLEEENKLGKKSKNGANQE